MQASVRILSVLALGVAVALVLAASAPDVHAYAGPTSQLVNAVRTLPHLGKRGSEGPVELPRPVETPARSFWTSPDTNLRTPTLGGKVEGMLPGSALPTGRGSGAILDPATRAERSIQQVIRKLG